MPPTSHSRSGKSVVRANPTSPNVRKSMRNVTPNEKYRHFIAQTQPRRRRTKADNPDVSGQINLAAETDDDPTLATAGHQATGDASAVREDRHSNVTRRTKPGRGGSVPASKKDVAEPPSQSIVLQDCFILLTDISKDISLADKWPITERQRLQGQTADKNVTKTRTKRKQSDTAAPIAVSPPKQPIVEIPIRNPPVESAPVPITTKDATDATQRKRRATEGTNPFAVLIVSVKRLAPPLSRKALQTLQHPEQLTETIRELEASQRQSVRETARFSSTTVVPAKQSLAGAIPEKKPRITFAKSPKIIVTACPSEESSATQDSAPAAAPPTTESKLFVKPQRSANRRKELGLVGSTLPLLLEDEDEESDVYEFLSSSQTVETKGKEKKSKQPKKAAPKPKGAIKKKAAPKDHPPVAKPARIKREPTKQKNPFGCNTKYISKLVKKIGGGPVKTDHQPVDYVVNLDIEDFFHEEPFRSNFEVAPQDEDSCEPPVRAPSPKRATNPTLERLKNPASLPLPLTSTPAAANSIRSNGASLLPPVTAVSPLNVGSPWRLQEDHIVPPSRYVPRNREMLPSYDSHQSVPPPGPAPAPAIANVTERRKTDPKTLPPAGTVATVGTPPQPQRRSLPKKALSPEEVLSEENFREIERMYNELKATSALSEKLIGVMRKYKHTMRQPPGSATDDDAHCRQYEGNMREACQKLRQWYTRSMQSFNRSMHIINQIQRGVTVAGRAAACPSPLSHAQQQTVENFNQSTDHFRSMLDELRDAMNDSNGENRSPPADGPPAPIGAPSPRNHPKSPAKGKKDVIVIPERAHITKRNPLKALNFVPLPQHNSPLMSPLAKPIPASPVPLRRGLQFDQTPTTDTVASNRSRLPVPDTMVPRAERSPAKQASAIAAATNDDVIIEDSCDEFAAEPPFDDDTAEEMENVPPPHEGNRSLEQNGSGTSTKTAPGVEELFGFEEESYGDLSEPQITLPMPFNISAATLKKRLNAVKELLPERPIFRERPLERSSGPTRLPTSTRLLRGVFRSPEKRSSRTLYAFTASTPRVTEGPPQSDRTESNGAAAAAATGDHQPPNVSAIETNQPPEAAVNDDDSSDQLLASVVLFDEPQNTFDRSTLQRTYTRIPRRKRAKNIYLANLGLSDDEDGTLSDDPLALSSDSDAEAQAARKKKEKQKKERRKARKKPVEETKEFKQFVEEFNSMCEEVERFEVIID